MRVLYARLAGIFVAAILGVHAAHAQQGPTIPNFWNPGERLAKIDVSPVQRLRFLTTTDFPPFNFIDSRKRLTGFNVDLARAICAKLGMLARCQIQALPWDELVPALEKGEGDAIIAGIEVSAENRAKFEFTKPYLFIPARFAARRGVQVAEPMADALPRLVTGLVAGSAHAAWFAKAFPGAGSQSFPTRNAALAALKSGKIDLVFTDALSLAFWLVSQDAGDCCVMAGGPYTAKDLTGNGFAIAFPKEGAELAAAANWALKELNDDGTFAELYLRYFPLGLY